MPTTKLELFLESAMDCLRRAMEEAEGAAPEGRSYTYLRQQIDATRGCLDQADEQAQSDALNARLKDVLSQ